MSNSAQLYERACRALPGGTSRDTVFHRPYPIYARSGHGPWVVDEDGVERFDMINNMTTLIHGHAHPVVVEAVVEQVRRGTCFGMPTRAEVELAEAITERLPSAERVRFTNSGTEAVMLALQISRAMTGRPKIARCEGAYHGAYDYVQVGLDALDPSAEHVAHERPRGITPAVAGDVVVIPFNDEEAAERAIVDQAHELAAVIVDPLPRRVGLLPATTAFLSTLRALTERLGIYLIFDEVISFRIGFRGAQGEFGVRPDLTTLGKVIGGGHPVGAVCGSVAAMAALDARSSGARVMHSGTFNGNPVTAAAGAAALSLLDRRAIDRLAALGERTRAGIRSALTKAGVPGQVTGLGSLFQIHLRADPLHDVRSGRPTPAERSAVFDLYVHLLNSGFLLTPTGFGALSTVTSEADVDGFVAALASGLQALSAAV